MSDSISMVIPVRDGERYLATAIRSLIEQDRPPEQIVVVDDGSTDGSAAAAAAFPEVTLVRLPPSGPPVARNAGIAACTGTLVGFLDADDYAVGDRLSRHAALLAADPALDGVVGLATNVFDTSAGIPDAARGGERVRSYSLGTMLIRRPAFDRIGWFHEELATGDTIEWIARARAAGTRWAEPDHLVLLRRAHHTNLTNTAGAGLGYLQLARESILRHRQAAP